MEKPEDYLSRMPFTIVFIDPLHTDFEGSSRKINQVIAAQPLAHARLHQPKFAVKILEMAAHRCHMRLFVRKADAAVKRDLYYIIRNGVFAKEAQMWAFINNPDNLAAVKKT